MTYRTSPLARAALPRRTPWWRIARAWADGTLRRIEARRCRQLLRRPTPSMIDAVLPPWLGGTDERSKLDGFIRGGIVGLGLSAGALGIFKLLADMVRW